MSHPSMPITLSNQPAAVHWGQQALLSANQVGMTIHLPTNEPLVAIQQAGRQLANQGIQAITLTGHDWLLEFCWAFWLGFRDSKQPQQLEWPTLPPEQQQQLQQWCLTVNWVREMVNRPSASLGPQQLAEEVIALLRQVAPSAIQAQWIVGETLKQQGYHGIYTVGRGSVREPLLLTVDYNPSGDANAPVFACLVGKGITFDSGGYCLKTSKAMESMKADMGGAALLTAALALAAARGLSQRVKLYLGCADNLVSGQAYQLGDIITYRNGKTLAQVTQLFEQTRQQAIVETIQWLVTSQQIEQALTDHLVQQAAQWAVAAFKQLVADADQPQLLWQQLQGSLHELQGDGQLTLRVHPSQSQALQNRLDNLHVIADQQLQPLQAFLESPLVKVELDLQHHLNLLIEQLLTSTFSPPEEDSALCAEGILQGTALAVSSEGASIESATIGQEETDV